MTIKQRLPLVALLIALVVSTFAAVGGNYAAAAPVAAVSNAPQAQPAAPRACVTPPANLMAWYPFDEAAGPISQDIVGGTNGAWMGSPFAVPGKVAGAIQVTGSGGYVSAPNAANLNFGTGDFAIDFWFRELAGQGGQRVFVDKRDNTVPALTGWSVGQVNGKLYIEMGDGATANIFPASTGPLVNDGNWHFGAVMVRRATPGVAIYVDGAVVGTYTSGLPAGNINSVANMWIGNLYPINGHQEIVYDGGRLDELELFNRALSPNELGMIYGAGDMGKCKGSGQPSPTLTRCIPGQTCPTDTPTATRCIPGQTCPTDTPTATPTCVTDPTGQCATPTPTTCVPGQTCPTDTPTATPTCVTDPTGQCATPTPTACVPGQTCPTNTPTDTATPHPSNTPTPTFTPQGQNSPTPTNTPACITPPANMTAWYPLDEAAGPISQDIVAGNNGLWVGVPVPVVGKVAGALRFSGPNGFVNVPSAPAINFGLGDFSVDAWMRETTGLTGRRVMLDKRDATTPAPTGYMLAAHNNKLVLQLGDGTTFIDYVSTSGPALNDGNWHLIAATVQRSPALVTLYIDGAVAGSYTTLPGNINSVTNLWMGRHHPVVGVPTETDFVEGVLDEVEFFNRALAATEVRGLYNADSAGKCKDQHPTPTPTATATCVPDPTHGCDTPTATPTCHPGQNCTTPTPAITDTPTNTPRPSSTPSPTPTGGCVAPPPNMVAWWPLDETGPATSFDIVGGNNGTWMFGPVPTPGKVAGALFFNKSFVQVPNAAAINFGQGDLSIDMWVKTNAVPGAVVMLDKRWNLYTTNFRGYSMYLYNGKLGFQLADGTGWSNYIAFAGPNVGDGNWHLVAVTVQRTNAAGLKLYVDGAVVYTGNPTVRPGSLTNVGPLRIGGPMPSPYHDRYLRGALDEIEFFNRVLTASQISSIYNAGSFGKCKDQHPTPTMTATPTPCTPGAVCPSATPTASNTPSNTPSPTATPCVNPFIDLNGNIFYPAISRLYCGHVINGTDATHYSPALTSTRAQFAKVVVLAFGIYDYDPPTPDFSDVPASYYAYQYIEAGYAFGILGGYDHTTCEQNGVSDPCYLPNKPITRAQLTKLVVNASGYDLINPETQTFSDVGHNNIFYQFVETAHQHMVINGYADNTFRPNNNIRRDEMAQIVNQGVNNP